MHVVPVLDLKEGLVVLADGGSRDAYRPVTSPLCADPQPAAVIDAFLGVYAFTEFYIADLGAIERGNANYGVVIELARAHPRIDFWIDGGFRDLDDLSPYDSISNVRFVIGSESLSSIEAYEMLCTNTKLNRHILSLDRRSNAELGPPTLIERPELWPQTLISMDLAHVGQDRGPGRQRLRDLANRRPDIDIAAAGGIRGIGDLEALAADNIRYALVATALHRKKIGSAELSRLWS